MRKLLASALISAACLFAQGPGFFPWWDSPIVRDLNLSEEQRSQIRATVRDYRDRLIEQRAAVEKAEGALQDLMNDQQVDEAKAGEAIERLIAARTDLMRTFSQMGLKLRKVLTPEQWQDLQRRRPKGFPHRMGDRHHRELREPGERRRSPETPPPGAPDL